MPETTLAASSPQEQLIGRISKEWGRSPDAVKAAMSLSFPTLKTPGQFTLAFEVAKKYDLDPFVKEIYAYVDNRGNLTLITGKDGFLKIARKQPGYLQIVSAAVYTGDEFEADFALGSIEKHRITTESLANRSGNPIGAYAILRMEGLPDVMKWVDWSEYCPAKTDYTPWAKQKAAMITKCATSVLIREAFGLSGLYDEAEISADSFGTNWNSPPEESTAIASKLKRKTKAIEYVEVKGSEPPVVESVETNAEEEGFKEIMETIDREEAEDEAEASKEPEVLEPKVEIETTTVEAVEADVAEDEAKMEESLDKAELDALNAELDIARAKFSKALAEARSYASAENDQKKMEASAEVVRINRLILSHG